MNQVKPVIGGHPLKLDNLTHSRDGLLEAFKGLASFLGDFFVASGGVVTTGGGFSAVTDGFVVLAGEVYRVDAESIPIVSGTLVWEVRETFDPIDPQLYEDSSNNNIHAIRVAGIAFDTTPDSDFEVANVNAAGDIISDNFVSHPPSTESVAGTLQLATNLEILDGTILNKAVGPLNLKNAFSQSVITLKNSWVIRSGGHFARIYRRPSHRVDVYARLTGGATNIVFGTINDVAARPPIQIIIPAQQYLFNNQFVQCTIVIDINGDMRINSELGQTLNGGGDEIILNFTYRTVY